MKKKSKNKTKSRVRTKQSLRPKCGLCGKTANLTKTECCRNWICDDAHEYRLFSFARNSCYRNHDRYTICGYHYHEEHEGNWKDCQLCRDSFETELYVANATNEHNFEKLKNPPSYQPTKCAKCGRVIKLAEGGYSIKDGGYYCGECSGIDWAELGFNPEA